MKAQKAGEKRRSGSRGGGIDTILSMMTQNERPLLPRRTMEAGGFGFDLVSLGRGEGGTLSQPYSSVDDDDDDEAEPLPLSFPLPLLLLLLPLPYSTSSSYGKRPRAHSASVRPSDQMSESKLCEPP